MLSYLLKAQNVSKYCFSRDTVELFAKSNLKRLELQEKYDLSLIEINNLKTVNSAFEYKFNLADSIIDNKQNKINSLLNITENQNKIINKNKKVLLIYKIAIPVALIIGLLL